MEATQLQLDADPLYGFVLDSFSEAEGVWKMVIWRFQKEPITGLFSLDPDTSRSAVFTQVSDVRDLNMPTGGYAGQSMQDGGVRTSVSNNSMVYAFDALPEEVNFKGLQAEFEFNIVDDPQARRHIGFYLLDPARPTYGYRIATLDGILMFSYLSGSFIAETVYERLTLPQGPLTTNTKYKMGLVVSTTGAITVRLNGVLIGVLAPPAILMPVVRLGVFFYIGGYITYSCRIGAVELVRDSRPPDTVVQNTVRDLGVVPSAAMFAASEAPGAMDMEFGGRGRFYGTVTEAQSKAMLQRRVRLFRSRDGYLARETWSAADGSYRFEGINERYQYDIEAWDHEKSFFSVVANNQIPEVVA